MTQFPAMPTMFEHSPSDRMQLLGSGDLPEPGNCVICGSGAPERKYVFLGIHLDFLGALLLCDLCITQTAEKIGCLAPSIAEMIHVQSQELAARVTELERTNEALNDRLTHYDAVFSGIDFNSSFNGVNLGVDSDSTELHVESTTEETQSDFTDEQSESDESVEILGTTNIISSESSDLTAGDGNSESDSKPVL